MNKNRSLLIAFTAIISVFLASVAGCNKNEMLSDSNGLPKKIILKKIYTNDKTDDKDYYESPGIGIKLYEDSTFRFFSIINGVEEEDQEFRRFWWDGHTFTFMEDEEDHGGEQWKIQCISKQSSNSLGGSMWKITKTWLYNGRTWTHTGTFNEDGTFTGDFYIVKAYAGYENTYEYNGKVLKMKVKNGNSMEMTQLELGNMLYQMLK